MRAALAVVYIAVSLATCRTRRQHHESHRGRRYGWPAAGLSDHRRQRPDFIFRLIDDDADQSRIETEQDDRLDHRNAEAGGTFSITVSAKGPLSTASKKLSFVIAKIFVSFTSANVATGVLGQSFSFQLAAPVTSPKYSAIGLPSGLRISSSSGLISGKPTRSGVFAPMVTVASKNDHRYRVVVDHDQRRRGGAIGDRADTRGRNSGCPVCRCVHCAGRSADHV